MSQKERQRKREYWGSNLGVVLAVAGSAVGLGNFLRFPGQVAKYGGGSFMIPYFFSLLIVAIPLAWTEWALGRRGGRLGYNSPPGIYRAVSGGKTIWGVCGGLTALAPFVINMYYIFVESWCLLYALQYLGGCLRPFGLGFSLFPNVSAGFEMATSEQYANFFNSFVGVGADGSLFRWATSPLAIATLICAATNFFLVYCGISKGIERFCKIAAPFLLLCSLFVIVRVATLGNPTGTQGQSFLDGLGFMWNPTRDILAPDGTVVGRTTVWTTLSNPEAWLAATSQIFFTVSICLGAIVTYASHVRPNEDVALSGLTATSANEFCEVVLGGLMTIPAAIMFLGVGAAEKFDSSFSLGFIVLPNVFGLTPAGQWVGFFFFSLLFLAGITSSISLVQPAVALFQEAFRWTRGASVLLAASVNLTGTAFVCWFTKELTALDAFDFWVAQFAPFIFAILQTSLVVWVWGSRNLLRELDRGAKMRVPRSLGFVVKYVSTPYLCVIFAFWCWKNLGDRVAQVAESPVAQLSLAYIGLIFVLLGTVAFCATRRWKREEAALQEIQNAEIVAEIETSLGKEKAR